MSRILVADDDDGNREVVAEALRGDGFEVVTAPDGVAALEEIVRKAPDLLLLDLMMPRRSGFEVLDAIGSRSFPVLAFSAIVRLEDHRYAERIGANDFIAKPFGLDRLTEKIRRLLPQ